MACPLILAALAEFDPEMIVEGTLEGLASARARGRVGGRPPKLTGARLGQAQRMLDDGELAAGEIAGVVGVGRSTLYANLSAYKDGGVARIRAVDHDGTWERDDRGHGCPAQADVTRLRLRRLPSTITAKPPQPGNLSPNATSDPNGLWRQHSERCG